MNKPLLGTKIAILVANGFCEEDFTQAQRALLENGALARVVSPEAGLVNGWAVHGNSQGFGHHFAVDANLSTALGADYDVLVIPGGLRSLDKLKTTAHTRRFISNFMAAEKPVVLFGEAPAILAHTEHASGRALSGAASIEAMMIDAGANWSAEGPVEDLNVISSPVSAETRADYIATAVAFVAKRREIDAEMEEAAAA